MMDKHLDVMAMAAQLGRPQAHVIVVTSSGDLMTAALALASFALAIFSNSTSTILAKSAPTLGTMSRPSPNLKLESHEIFEALASSGRMVDRIVPLGDALSMSMDWDGKQSLSLLSRQVEVR